ncbi:MAG: hypothetical protein ACXU86_02495 [Archangium sp.]
MKNPLNGLMKGEGSTGAARALVVFLCLHLGVATLFAFRGFQQTLRDAKRTTAKPLEVFPALSTYADVTASSQGFGFFAPSVSSVARVLVTGCKRSDGNWKDLDLGVKGEGQQLLSSFLGIGLQGEGSESKEVRETLSRSLAAGAMNAYPEIDTVIVKYQVELIGDLRSPERRERVWVNANVFNYYRQTP